MNKRLDICSCSQVSNRKNPCEDRISCLPDEILYFIQSFLTWKKVTHMSILSRRWLNLSSSKHNASVLQFGDPGLLGLHLCAPIIPDETNQKPECHKIVSTISRKSHETHQWRECDLLSHWIDNVRIQKPDYDKSIVWMTSHTPDVRNRKGEGDKTVNWMSRISKIHKGRRSNKLRVSYTLYKCYKRKDIDNWWEDTLAKEFQNLELIFLSNDCQDSSYVFPDRFLTYCSDCLFWILSSDSFDSHFIESSGLKSLKSLSLYRILITHKSIDFFLLNCPFLERLEVVESPVLVFFQIKNAPSLALKHLKIVECENLGIIEISYSNIVSLEIQSSASFSLKKLPRLIELSIVGIPRGCRRDSLCHPKLKTLTLDLDFDSPKALAKDFGLFSKLTLLERLVIHVDASDDVSLVELITVMNACPLLEEFVLMLLHFSKPRRSGSFLKKKAERCSLKHLKVVELLGYYGGISDVELTVHIMECADNLERVIIDTWNPEINNHRYEEEAEARSLVSQQLKEYVSPLVELIIR